MMKRVFRNFLVMIVIAIINNIMVYSRSSKEHEGHLRRVLTTLRAELLKCEFWLQKFSFLSHVVSIKGIVVDPTKVEVGMK